MFEIGKVSVEQLAENALKEAGQDASVFLKRHQQGDWGDVAEETRRKNDAALAQGGRLESVYHTARGEKLLVVTEPDRKLTSITIPSIY